MTCFETRLGCIDAETYSWHQQMIDSNTEIFRLSLKLRFSIPFYKLFSTPTWRKLIQREDFFFGYKKTAFSCYLKKLYTTKNVTLFIFQNNSIKKN